ncbi:PAAR domain-containing protein [Trinickia sp.]|uniref:PAAR domain-containing protein n=1 Tax=Trinickia sp. TaxID=2571163 RepID=UPI003F814A1E
MPPARNRGLESGHRRRQAHCAKRRHRHGTQTIAEGDEAGMVSGSQVALHGHCVTCGCTLVSQGTTIGVV